jgi:hypothetical protein
LNGVSKVISISFKTPPNFQHSFTLLVTINDQRSALVGSRTKRLFSFGASGMFVDSAGRVPKNRFRGSDPFGAWLHEHIEVR